MLFTLVSFVLASLAVATDFGYKAMKCIDSQNFRKASKYLRQARMEENFVAFSNLSGMLSFDPEDPNLQDLILSLIAKDESAYLQILSEIPSLTKMIDHLHVKATIEAMQKQHFGGAIELLMTYFAEGNHIMFKAVANECHLDATQKECQDLIIFIAESYAFRFLDTLAEALINRENSSLQVFIVDIRMKMEEQLAKERAGRRQELAPVILPVILPAQNVLPVVQIKPDPHPEDCVIHSSLGPKVKIWISSSPDHIANAQLNGADNVRMIRTMNPNIHRFALLDAEYDEVILPPAGGLGFERWCTEVEKANNGNINGMLADLDLNLKVLKLKRIGWKKDWHSIVLVRENKESGSVELPESAAKFYFGEETSTEIKLQEADLIYFVPTCLLNLAGMRPGIGSFMGIISLDICLSDPEKRMFEFAELRKNFVKYVGAICLYGIFFH